jgi:hypothetical protein
MAREAQAVTTKGWLDIATSVAANAADLPHLQAHSAKLAEMLNEARALFAEQAALTASKQEISKRLQRLLDGGEKLATFLRTGVRENYGNRSEKLVEFGLQPFRGVRRKTKEAPPKPEPTPGPAVEGTAPSSADPDSGSTR